MKILKSILFLLLSFAPSFASEEDSSSIFRNLDFNGQLIAWSNYNPKSEFEILGGLRVLPQLNFKIDFDENKKLDFEASANIFGNFCSNLDDSLTSEIKLKPYRLWARYSGEQFELRAGLQKINFGSATLIRPLMWFDAVDPRDPLQLTNGVWGVLGRYYFLNNANLWSWVLFGNSEKRPWDIGETYHKTPEFGGRFQYPLPSGETAITYHFRNTKHIDDHLQGSDTLEIPEHRLGLDGKFDIGVGLWFEAVQISKTKNIGILTNQSLLNLGTDYTFDIGNGLTILAENLFVSYNEVLGEFDNNYNFSALSMNYPFGMDDYLNIIVFYDWENKNTYNFINWQHTLEPFKFYLMGYLNPKEYNLPQQGESGASYAGYGVQLMFVWNF